MTRFATLVPLLLGYLTGCAEAADGQAAGRFSLEFVGLVVAAFLFYLALSGLIMALFSRKPRHKRPVAEHRGLSEMASAPTAPSGESPEAPTARRP